LEVVFAHLDSEPHVATVVLPGSRNPADIAGAVAQAGVYATADGRALQDAPRRGQITVLRANLERRPYRSAAIS
jgi:hypothetical protein